MLLFSFARSKRLVLNQPVREACSSTQISVETYRLLGKSSFRLHDLQLG